MSKKQQMQKLYIFWCNVSGKSWLESSLDKAVETINFRANNHDNGEHYKNDKILRISDYTKLLHYLFVRLKLSIPPFQNYFIKSENWHQYNTRHTKQNSAILILISIP